MRERRKKQKETHTHKAPHKVAFEEFLVIQACSFSFSLSRRRLVWSLIGEANSNTPAT